MTLYDSQQENGPQSRNYRANNQVYYNGHSDRHHNNIHNDQGYNIRHLPIGKDELEAGSILMSIANKSSRYAPLDVSQMNEPERALQEGEAHKKEPTSTPMDIRNLLVSNLDHDHVHDLQHMITRDREDYASEDTRGLTTPLAFKPSTRDASQSPLRLHDNVYGHFIVKPETHKRSLAKHEDHERIYLPPPDINIYARKRHINYNNTPNIPMQERHPNIRRNATHVYASYHTLKHLGEPVETAYRHPREFQNDCQWQPQYFDERPPNQRYENNTQNHHIDQISQFQAQPHTQTRRHLRYF